MPSSMDFTTSANCFFSSPFQRQQFFDRHVSGPSVGALRQRSTCVTIRVGRAGTASSSAAPTNRSIAPLICTPLPQLLATAAPPNSVMSSRRGMCPMRLETGDRIVVKRADWKGRLEKKVMSALGQKHMCGAKGDVRFSPKSDHVHCKRLLPLCANSGHCMLYSNTSSAHPTSVLGTLRPSALAVLRLIYSSTFVDCCTGSSAGLSPLRIRPV